MTEPGVVTLTMNPSLDVSTSAERVVSERKLRCAPPHQEPGGGGINVSRAIAELGGVSLAVFPCGGPTGDVFAKLLYSADVEHRRVVISEETRRSFTVLEDATGDQYRFVLPGPELTEDECDACLREIASIDPAPGYLVASGSLPPGVPENFYETVTAAAARRGIRVVLDAPGDVLRAAVRSRPFLIKPNYREAEELAEGKLSPEEAARRAAAEGCDVVVLSLGAAGAFLASAEHPDGIHLRSPTVEVQSKVGAGDSMVGGIVRALQRGEDIVDAVRFGVAAGAAAVTTPGSELCRAEDVERLVDEVGVG